MPHHEEGDTGTHPFDPADTDWGKQVVRQIDLHGTQIRELDMYVFHLRNDHTSLRAELKANTDQTNAIKGDTEWLVNVFKGSKAIGPLVLGITVILSAIGGFVAWLLSVMHWPK